MEEAAGRGLRRLELRVERLDLRFRFTFAFHAREVRFECDRGQGFERLFHETFSFELQRHDPTELHLQLEDLLTRPELLGPGASRRESADLMARLLALAPGYLEGLLDEVVSSEKLGEPMRERAVQDVALLARIFLRFQEQRGLDDQRESRLGGYLLTKLVYRAMSRLMEARVEPDYLARYVRGEVDPSVVTDDVSDSGILHILETGEQEVVNRILVRTAERAFLIWLEGVCLETDNQAFEREDSPFADREAEVLRAICIDGRDRVDRADDLCPFLRRPSRDCVRVLGELERWFLRRYDIFHSSGVIRHQAMLAQGVLGGSETLTWHLPRNYLLTLGVLSSPFVAAAFAYPLAPTFFDVLCSFEVLLVNVGAIWFLTYQFCWKRDLTLFRASVPRIGAGIIVGFLPVFLIDEVWALAGRDAFTLFFVVTFLGLATLLYIYVEIQRRLGNTAIAFSRARGIFLLGTLEAAALGVVMTSLVGRFMVGRNWSPDGTEIPVESLQALAPPLIGQLPRIIGFEPFFAFPSAVLIMTFLSFFIGIFLQLMWEELPITEPL